MKSSIDKIKDLLGNGKIEEAMALLSTMTKGINFMDKDLIVIKARFAQSKRDWNQGRINYDQWMLINSNAIAGLCDLLDLLGQEPTPQKMGYSVISSSHSFEFVISLFKREIIKVILKRHLPFYIGLLWYFLTLLGNFSNLNLEVYPLAMSNGRIIQYAPGYFRITDDLLNTRYFETGDSLLISEKDRAVVAIHKENHWAVFDRDMNIACYDEVKLIDDDLIIAQKAGKHMLIIKTSNALTSIEYDVIVPLNKRLLKVNLERKWGIINQSGEVVVPIAFDTIDNQTHGCGLISALKNGREYLFDNYGNYKSEQNTKGFIHYP
jgi:hypothetical protein